MKQLCKGMRILSVNNEKGNSFLGMVLVILGLSTYGIYNQVQKMNQEQKALKLMEKSTDGSRHNRSNFHILKQLLAPTKTEIPAASIKPYYNATEDRARFVDLTKNRKKLWKVVNNGKTFQYPLLGFESLKNHDIFDHIFKYSSASLKPSISTSTSKDAAVILGAGSQPLSFENASIEIVGTELYPDTKGLKAVYVQSSIKMDDKTSKSRAKLTLRYPEPTCKIEAKSSNGTSISRGRSYEPKKMGRISVSMKCNHIVYYASLKENNTKVRETKKGVTRANHLNATQTAMFNPHNVAASSGTLAYTGTCIKIDGKPCKVEGLKFALASKKAPSIPPSSTPSLPSNPVVDKVKGTVDGYRFEFPCPSGRGFSWFGCDTPKWDARNANRKFGGDPNKSYKVTLHVRGVVESMTYSDGKSPAKSEYESQKGSNVPYFYIGGRPTHRRYNWFAMSVGEPAQTYYFNRTKRTQVATFALNYKATIIIKGGTSVQFKFDENDRRMAANQKRLVVSGVDPYPKPYPGQFIQVDVINAVPIN